MPLAAWHPVYVPYITPFMPPLLVFQSGYTDSRFSAPPGGSELNANLGRLPILECAEGSIGQSAAINYYVAQKTGLLGSNPFEASQIISFSEHMKELSTAFRALVPYGVEPTAEALNTFFDDSTATDYTGPADGSKRSSRQLLWFLGRMENIVGDGFAVGGKLSLADVLLFNAFADSLTEEQTLSELPAHRREPFCSLARTQAALAKHPKLAKIVAGVAAHPNIQKWLSIRGKQGF